MAIPIDKVKVALPSEFSVEDFLGAGGQGSVYRGKVAGRAAAIKLFEKDIDPRRVDRELDSLRTIACPNLVKVLSDCQITIDHRTIGVIAYEFHPGGNLRKLVTNGPACSEEQLLRIGVDVGTAVESLWQRRVVHRDIKPDNVVVAADGRNVLVDVAFARHVDLSAISGLGQAPGTPGYKSPEQAAGRRNLTIRSDIFSLGTTLYELAARQHPFLRNQSLIGKHSPRTLIDWRRDLSPQFCASVHQMISASPIARPVDAIQRLRALLGR